jgi:hypothetical protein
LALLLTNFSGVVPRAKKSGVATRAVAARPSERISAAIDLSVAAALAVRTRPRKRSTFRVVLRARGVTQVL